MTPVDPLKCKHPYLQFTVGGTAIVCQTCNMRYSAMSPKGWVDGTYYNINILSIDARVDPNNKISPPVH